MERSEYIRLGRVSELLKESRKVYRLGNRQIAVFQVDGRFYALKNLCPHHGVELGEGSVDNGRVKCPGHGFQFDLVTGQCDRDPSLWASTYDLKVEGDELFVRI